MHLDTNCYSGFGQFPHSDAVFRAIAECVTNKFALNDAQDKIVIDWLSTVPREQRQVVIKDILLAHIESEKKLKLNSSPV